MRDIYAEAAQHGRILVGGMDPNVGIGGYITGGGHSPISGQYGLAADQILQMEMVTPGGELVIANEATNTDPFWAMRGVSEPFVNVTRLVKSDLLKPSSGRRRDLRCSPLRDREDIPYAIYGPVCPPIQRVGGFNIRLLVCGGSRAHKTARSRVLGLDGLLFHHAI